MFCDTDKDVLSATRGQCHMTCISVLANNLFKQSNSVYSLPAVLFPHDWSKSYKGDALQDGMVGLKRLLALSGF